MIFNKISTSPKSVLLLGPRQTGKSTPLNSLEPDLIIIRYSTDPDLFESVILGSASELSGLKIFRDYFPEVHKCIAVSTKEKKRMVDGILICDWIEQLKLLGL